MQVLGFIVGGILIVVVCGGLIVGGFWLKRTVNYKLMYKSMVEQTVRNMVAPEALKPASR